MRNEEYYTRREDVVIWVVCLLPTAVVIGAIAALLFSGCSSVERSERPRGILQSSTPSPCGSEECDTLNPFIR